jgi:hypothetical protein
MEFAFANQEQQPVERVYLRNPMMALKDHDYYNTHWH